MAEFSDFIEDMNLIDLQLEDGNYTWFKGDNQDRASKIDRFLIYEEWDDDSFSNIKQIPLQRLASDHISLALEGARGTEQKLFQLSNQNSRTGAEAETGNLGHQRKNLLSQMAELDEVLGDRVLTEEETVKKAALFMEYEELIKNEEISWRQKSRALWLKEGDRNTKFFHKVANAHKKIQQYWPTDDPGRINRGAS
ncbi:uncharacterized protein LOC132041754 [Lycium ferocissimum]|uniref:uncharacterized protein LOC132041754 n=1 Tax=Lycium ferocissimum TaxID=112874 RepID=UPI00281677E9|nr:uncharacterized protein LOC132041754 [Lycium ferocissimum]